MTRCVKVLGSAIGDAGFAEGLARQRCVKAHPMLPGLGGLGGVQAGLALLRSCASYAKLPYSARTTLWKDEFCAFDADVKRPGGGLTDIVDGAFGSTARGGESTREVWYPRCYALG